MWEFCGKREELHGLVRRSFGAGKSAWSGHWRMDGLAAQRFASKVILPFLIASRPLILFGQQRAHSEREVMSYRNPAVFAAGGSRDGLRVQFCSNSGKYCLAICPTPFLARLDCCSMKIWFWKLNQPSKERYEWHHQDNERDEPVWVTGDTAESFCQL